MKRSTETRRCPAEIKANPQKHYGGMAERPVDKKATDVMRGKIKDQFDLDASLSERTKAAQELLKRNVDDRKMNLELAKLEAQFKDNGSDEDAKDNFMDALNSTASEVWTDDE